MDQLNETNYYLNSVIGDIENTLLEVDPDTAKNIIRYRPTATLPRMPICTPFATIIVQPAKDALRWRYLSEGRTAGSLSGANSFPNHTTYPSIKVVGYTGEAKVVVSCVTDKVGSNNKHKAHPHNLVGRDCLDGVCVMPINPKNMTVTFTNLGIQCVKKKDVRESLETRKRLGVDPFNAQFSHMNQNSIIDLSVIRLAFQVFLQNPITKKFDNALNAVVSSPIVDRKPNSLKIHKLSDSSSPVLGGKTIILLCEKIKKHDIQIRFFQERDGNTVWENLGSFQNNEVHNQVAICFRTPPYTTPYTTDVREPVKVQVQLVRISDNVKGPSVEFQYIPMIPLNRKNNLISMEQVDAAPNINYQHNLNINYGSNGLTQTFFGYNTENDFQNFMDF